MTSIVRHIVNLPAMKTKHCLHTCACLNGLSKVMKKIMGSSSKKKKHHYTETPVLPNPNTFSQGSYEGKKSGNSRRASVLNKLFMRHITDLMTTGESASEFSGYGIEINRVQVTPDYNGVNVFWLAKGTEHDAVVEKILHCNSGQLRHELSQLRVMGVVPRIRFVKDKKYAQVMEVDVRLAKADFGDDYVPLEPAAKLKSQLELHTEIEPRVKEEIKKLENEQLTETEEHEELIPPMPQNVLGLNHSEIMGRIQKSVKKSQATHRLEGTSEETRQAPTTYNLDPVRYPSAKVQRDAFKRFLAKRQVLKNQAHQADKNYRPELDYLAEEMEEMRKKQQLGSFNFDKFFDVQDYVEEDDNVK